VDSMLLKILIIIITISPYILSAGTGTGYITDHSIQAGSCDRIQQVADPDPAPQQYCVDSMRLKI
jgi:hypothetical protein